MQDTLFPMPQEDLTTDDYWTPKWVFDALNVTFDIDVACPPGGPIHTPCKAFYTKETNGLTAPWVGLVWMNPPYSQTSPWVHKWIQHGNGLALLPDLNRQWRNDLYEKADGIVALPAKMKFDVSDDRRPDIRYSTCLYAIGEVATNALHQSGIGRVR